MATIVRDVEKLEPLDTAGKGCKIVWQLGKTVGKFLKTLKIRLLYDLAIPLGYNIQHS